MKEKGRMVTRKEKDRRYEMMILVVIILSLFFFFHNKMINLFFRIVRSVRMCLIDR